MLIESVPIGLAKVAGFAHSQDDGLHETVKPAEYLLRRNLTKVPWSYCGLDWFQHGVLTHTLRTAEHERVVDLLVGKLHAVRQPFYDVIGFIGENLLDVLDPWC